MNEKKIKIPFNAALNPQDTEDQTYGCRANNPNICSSAYLPKVCAFVRDDCICKKPSAKWKKQFIKLSNS